MNDEKLYISPEGLAYVYQKLKSEMAEYESRIAALEARLADVATIPAEEVEF